MNLQPVYPSRPYLRLVCANHGTMTANSHTAFADLDAEPGTYYCSTCVATYFMTHLQMTQALLERDQRELHLAGGLMNKGVF